MKPVKGLLPQNEGKGGLSHMPMNMAGVTPGVRFQMYAIWQVDRVYRDFINSGHSIDVTQGAQLIVDSGNSFGSAVA